MLRDEADRAVGAARGEVIPFPVPRPLRDIEKAWIHTCQQNAGRRQLVSEAFEADTLPNLVLRGLESLLTAGKLVPAHVGVLVPNGERGRPPPGNCAIAYRLWAEAMDALEGAVLLRPKLSS